MAINHNIKKLSIYFNKKNYWRPSDCESFLIQTKLGPFFLNLKDRLEDNHYDSFDESGLPVRKKNGQWIYNYTTICSYALAKWQLYLETGDNKYTEQLFITIDYLFNSHKKTDYDGIIFPYHEILCAMNQGEALSVLARGYELTGNKRYIDFADKIIKPYNVLIKDYGVKGKINELENIYWYEEFAVLPHKHILNGMIYALIGLWEIYQVMPQLTNAKELFEKGIEYLENALPLFDTGKWSWYWVDEKNTNYIASVMYHNLHICQLNYIYSITGKIIFKEYADKFEAYSNKKLNKLWAGFSLLNGKIKMKLK